MLFLDLIKECEGHILHNRNPQVTDISCDSREVSSGNVFFALSGYTVEGSIFIPHAIDNGASAIIAQKSDISEDILSKIHNHNVACFVVDNPRQCLAMLCAKFYGAGLAKNIAITGTNGKTSTMTFIRQMLTHQQKRCASIGTIDIRYGDVICDTLLTTPDPVNVHKYCRLFQQEDCEYLIMEASSHALHQYRLDGIVFDIVVFTNLSQDHGDYHASEQQYFEAKARLFLELMRKDTGIAIVNINDKHGRLLVRLLQERNLSYISVGTDGHISATIDEVTATSQKGQLRHKSACGAWEEFPIEVPLIGEFQWENVLLTIASLWALGEMSLSEIVQQIGHLKGAKGRFDYVGSYNDARVMIDFAHTPHALENVLKNLRAHCKGRLNIVFGCGGDRDKTKRPLMGAIAASYCDVIYVTDDNPRSEDAASIRLEIMQACRDKAIECPDRKKAIEKAMTEARVHDTVLIAGKGHETGQIIQGITYPFNDYDIVYGVMNA